MSNEYCCVPGSKSLRRKDPDLSFHQFPKQGNEKVHFLAKFGLNTELIDRYVAWIMQLKIEKKASPSMTVCSRHFNESDFTPGSRNKRLKRLKRNAVPSVNLPERKHDRKPQEASQVVRKRIIEDDNLETERACLDTHDDTQLEENVTKYTEEDLETAETLLSILSNQPAYDGPKTFRDFEVQVNTSSKLTVVNLMTSEKALNSFTGLHSFKLLNFILESIDLVHHDTRSHKLTIKDRIIFIKLKTDVSFAILSLLFGISDSLCITYLTDMLKILSTVLKHAIYFPSNAEIDQNIPLCFKNFEDTQIVLDCTEIYVLKPKCLCCRVRFYSHYKSSQTVKFMTGVTPAGIISFISKPYGGRASDKLIFEDSQIVDLIAPGSSIMVDKGLIDEVCNKYNIKIYRPPFLGNKKQLDENEAAFNEKIAAARVHIERCNQPIKIFTILNSKLQWSFVKYIDDIFTIACAITNLSTPILANDKFMK